MSPIENQIKNQIDFDPTTKKNVKTWLTGGYDPKTKAKILKLIHENPKEINDAFYTQLSFGTGGLRGIMGVGTNRMNQYTVRAATQGLANYLAKQPSPKKEHAVFIGYDSRHNSRFFAEESAKVLAGNGIRVYLFSELRPTPLVSFGCRQKNCSAGIMITASHNPPEYNGYKVYWGDGGQIVPPHDRGIIGEVEKITDMTDLSMVKVSEDLFHPLIECIENEIDHTYLDCVEKQQHYPEENKQHGNNLKIVYTSLHGVGITLVPETLKRWGFTNLYFVENQMTPDGDFPTVKSPNPEEKEALELGIEAVKKNDADILIATDPDGDRVGVAVKHEGAVHLLNGNQIACLCLYHVCEALTKQNRMPPKAAFVKTIGTTELFKTITDSYGATCFDVLTGFKYIAEKIHQWEQDPNDYQFVFGGEESYGYSLGTDVRDKDAIISSALICEVALREKLQGKTLIDLLYELYNKFGAHVEKLFSFKFEETKEGKEQMTQGMKRLRKTPPSTIGDIEIVSIEDYSTSIKTFLKSGKTEPLELPESDVLRFWLADGTKLMIRPSGTEPKIKIYCGVVINAYNSIDEALQNGENHASRIIEELKPLLYH